MMTSWHRVLTRPGRCVGVVAAHFNKTFALVRYDEAGALELFEVHGNGEFQSVATPVIHSRPETHWRICADHRNNLYVLAHHGRRLTVAFLTYRVWGLAWTRHFLVEGPGESSGWLSVDAAADRALFLTASLTGTIRVRETTYTDESVVLCLTHTDEVLFCHKVQVDSAVLAFRALPVESFYVAGVARGGEIVLHNFSKVGAFGPVVPTEDLSVVSVDAACLLASGIVAIAGLVTVAGPVRGEDITSVFHITMQPRLGGEICRVAIHPVNDEVAIELFEVYPQGEGNRALLHLQVEDRGCYILDGTESVYSFSGQLVYGFPQVQVMASLEDDGVVLVRGGELVGDFYVNRRLYDVSDAVSRPYLMRFIAARVPRRLASCIVDDV